jgi:hypothetical protein
LVADREKLERLANEKKRLKDNQKLNIPFGMRVYFIVIIFPLLFVLISPSIITAYWYCTEDITQICVAQASDNVRTVSEQSFR